LCSISITCARPCRRCAAIHHLIHRGEVEALTALSHGLVQRQRALGHGRRRPGLPGRLQREAQVLDHELGSKAADVAAAGRNAGHDALRPGADTLLASLEKSLQRARFTEHRLRYSATLCRKLCLTWQEFVLLH